jgi:hypothetical protein
LTLAVGILWFHIIVGAAEQSKHVFRGEATILALFIIVWVRNPLGTMDFVCAESGVNDML